MSDIYVIVENEDASITDADLISSGDVNAVKAHFTFTENWDEYPIKTMFVYSITKAEENRIGTDFIGIDSEGIAIIPKETLSREGRLFLCVIGQKTDNEDVLTSTRVTLKIRKGFEIEIEDEDDDFLSRLLPAGGEQGEFLVKNSDNDFDYGWGKPDVIFDTEMSDESEHGVQNKVIKAYVDSMASGVSLTVFTINPFGTGTTVTCNKTYEELSTLIENNTFVGVVKSETPTGEFCFMAIDEIVTSAGTKLFYAYSLKGDTKYKCVITTTSSSMSAQWAEIPSGDEYTAGDNIDIINNVISADIVEPIVTFTVESTMTTPPYRVSCDTPYSEIMERYNANKLKVQAYIHEGNNVFSYKAPMTYIYYGGGDTKFYFEYLDGDNTVEWEVVKASENNENYTVSKTIHSYNYTAGDGIRINQREVSVKAPDTFNVDVTDFTEYTFNDQASMYAAYGFTINQLNRINSNNKIDTLVALATEGTETTDDITCAVTGFNYESEEDTETANHHTDYYKIYFEYINTVYELTVAVSYTNDEADNYKVKLTEKSVGDIYALRKYYGNENINLGNNNGVPANTFDTGAIWNEAIGVGNTITGQYNSAIGNNNNVSGAYNNITGYGLYINGQFNVAFGPIMPEAKKLQGMCNIVTAYGNDVSGNENAVFGNNNKVRGDSHLIAGHNHDVSGYNNVVSGEYSTVKGTDNAVFGLGYGTIEGDSNIVNGYYTYVKKPNSGTSQHNIIGGTYHTVTGSNNLVVGEGTTAGDYTFPDDTEAFTFDHINGYDNIYSSFQGAITGNRNILISQYGKVYGSQNIVSGEHITLKGNNNIVAGSGADYGFVGSNNISILGYGSTVNDVENSSLMLVNTPVENLRYAALNAYWSHFENAQHISATGYGLKFNGTLDENDYYTNPLGLTIIGKWNEDGNNRNDYVFVVGNGTNDNNRNNAFTISTDGQVTCTVNNQKHTIFGSSCVTDELPQTGQEDTLYVLYEEEGTDTTDITDDTITVLGMYIWKGGEYFALPSGGGGSSYTAGDNIDITGNVISADIIEPIATFTLTPTGTTPAYTVSCDTTYSELISRYNSDKLKTQLTVEGNNGNTVLNMDRFEYRSGVAKFYFEYTEEDYLYVYEITKTGNPSADTYSYNKISTRVQKKLTAGTNITIDNTDPDNPVINATGGGGGTTYTAGVGIDIDSNNAINTVRIKVAHLDVTGTPSINYTWAEINNLLGSYTAYGSATCYLWYGHTGAVFDTAIGSYDISNNGISIHFTCIYGNTIEYRSYYLSSENVFTMTQRTVTDYQNKLTAGTGISIDPTTNTISLDLSQAEGGGF